MAIETLLRADAEAAMIIELDVEGYNEASHSMTTAVEGITTPDGIETYGSLSVFGSGADGVTPSGGARFMIGTPEQLAIASEMLAREMRAKQNLRMLHHLDGAKFTVNGNPYAPYLERWGIGFGSGRRLGEMDLFGLEKYRTAGDVGSNGLAMAFLQGYASTEAGTNDPYYLASVGGKSARHKGLELRPSATGLGVHAIISQEVRSRERGSDEKPDRVAIQTFGNVASYLSYFSGKDEYIEVVGINERNADGTFDTLVVEGDGGMKVSRKMIADIVENPEFRGSKLAALKAALEADEKNRHIALKIDNDPLALFKLEVDWVVGTVTGFIDDDIASLMVKNVKRGWFEAGNGTTLPSAHMILVEAGLKCFSDIETNGLGNEASGIEVAQNVDMVDLGQDFDPSLYDSSTIYNRLVQSQLSVARMINRLERDYPSIKDRRVLTSIAHLSYGAMKLGVGMKAAPDIDRTVSEDMELPIPPDMVLDDLLVAA